jgi:hypothetical protein
MVETKKTKSAASGSSGFSDFKFCCEDSENMVQMMRKFCRAENGAFDCGKMMQMMQKMHCASTEKSDNQ